MSPLNPEQFAREKIDALLTSAGWCVQSMDALNRNASEGVAVREFHTNKGPCDYIAAERAGSNIAAPKRGRKKEPA